MPKKNTSKTERNTELIQKVYDGLNFDALALIFRVNEFTKLLSVNPIG